MSFLTLLCIPISARFAGRRDRTRFRRKVHQGLHQLQVQIVPVVHSRAQIRNEYLVSHKRSVSKRPVISEFKLKLENLGGFANQGG